MSDIITELQRVVWAEMRCRSNEVVLGTFGAHIRGLLIDGVVVGKVICYIASSFSSCRQFVRMVNIENL